MAVTINGILCDEIVDGLEETIDWQQGPAATKSYICNWTDRNTVAKGLLGFNHATTILGRITVNLPLQYVDNPLIYCQRVRITPKGSPLQGTAGSYWPKAIVTAEFGYHPWSFQAIDDPAGQNQLPPPPETGGYIYAEQELNSSVETVSLPGRNAKFRATQKPAGTDVFLKLAIVDIIITFHRVPYLPSAQCFALAGNISNGPCFGVDSGKLIFLGYRTHRTKNSDGSATTDVTAHYQARSKPWDSFPNPDTNQWDVLLWPDGVTPLFDYADLTQTIPQGY